MKNDLPTGALIIICSYVTVGAQESAVCRSVKCLGSNVSFIRTRSQFALDRCSFPSRAVLKTPATQAKINTILEVGVIYQER